jgi:hypothetical protein
MDDDALNLEIIVNNKVRSCASRGLAEADEQVTDNGQAVIQLETAIGAAIKVGLPSC